MNVEAAVSSRSILLALLGALVLGWVGYRAVSSREQRFATANAVTIDKQQATYASRTFDPHSPPNDMPPLTAAEEAECDSNFQSNASVGGSTRQTDATHGVLTITQAKLTLQLNVIIWAPAGENQRVLDHEEGHRQISEYYYQSADKLAHGIAAAYIGKQIAVSGTDLNAESNKALQQAASDITNEYDKELNPAATQVYYDNVTDHGRNEMAVKDAVAASIQNVATASVQPPAAPGN
jgi:hypothetical protein